MVDFLIIGGGIIGMMTARNLSEVGSVVLVDKSSCGRESSWAGAGIISPLYPWKYSDFINDLSQKSQKVYKQLCDDLLDKTGIDPEYINSGLKMFDEFDTNIAKNWLKKNNLKYELVDKTAIFDVAQVRNPKILQALKNDILQKKVQIIENVKIKRLNIRNNQVFGADNIKAKNTIICAGSWSADLVDIDIYPVKGQIITVFDNSKTIKNIILKNGRYIIPRQDGIILVGSTMENVGFDDSLNTQIKQQLFNFATGIFPHLKDCKITNHWCGFRPATSSNPIVKADDKIKNLFINTGHFRNGVNTAPESANIITKLLVS